MKPRKYYVCKLPQAQGETLAQLKELLLHYKEDNNLLCNLCGRHNLALARDFMNTFRVYKGMLCAFLPNAISLKTRANYNGIKDSRRFDVRELWLTSVCKGNKTLCVPADWYDEEVLL